MNEYWEGELHSLNCSYLIEGKIIGVGLHPKVKEGGLTIDYEKNGRKMRVVFGYSDLGLWVVWKGEKGKPEEKDLLLSRIDKVMNSYIIIDTLEQDSSDNCFIFREGTKEVLRLSTSEIKLLPESVGKLFSQKKKDLNEILLNLSALT